MAPGSSRPLGDTVRDIALADALEAGRDVSVDDLVFTNDTEAKIRGGPSSSRADGNVCAKRAGLEHVKLHGLRHFVATELLTGGIDLCTVSNRLGHARTSTTLDIYWAWVPAQDEAAAEHLDAVLDSPEETR